MSSLDSNFISHNVEQTHQWAAKLASQLSPRDILLLVGRLGVGKTTLVKGIAAGLGVEDVNMVTSPTYTLVNVYQAKYTIYHIDLYRLEQEHQLTDQDFSEIEEYLFTDGVVLVEWPRLIMPRLMDMEYHLIELDYLGDENNRHILYQKFKPTV